MIDVDRPRGNHWRVNHLLCAYDNVVRGVERNLSRLQNVSK